MTPLLSTPLLRAQSDRRLSALAASGHDRAFEEIVERYRRPLQRYLRRLLSEPLAEDVLQATFVRAWQALRAGSEVRDLRPWLYRIGHNQAVNALRAAGSALPVTRELSALSTEAEVEQREELRATLDGIDALPDRQRAAILAVAVADRPHADVAAELGLSDGALRQLLLRARSALRATATAITPYPIVAWAASGQDVSAARVAEVAASAGGAGVAIKTGAAMLAAGAIVAGAPSLHDKHVDAPPAAKHVRHEHAAAARKAVAVAVPATSHRVNATPAAAAVRRAAVSSHNSHHASGSSGSDDETSRHSGSSGSGPGRSGTDDGASDDAGRGGSTSSGPSTSGSGTRHGDDDATAEHEGGGGSGPSGSGSGEMESGGSGSGSSGSGSATAPVTQAAPLATDDHGGNDGGGTPDGDDGTSGRDGSSGGTSGHD